MGRANNEVIPVNLKDKTKKKLIVKSNELVEARYRLTANEQKIILAMVSSIQPEDEDFKTYRFLVKDLSKFLGVKYDAIYTEIEKISNKLLDRRLVIFNPEKNSTLTTAWISSSEYFHGAGYVELCFDPKLKPYLLKLKEKFVQYDPSVIKQIKSGHSIRIYELLKQYLKIGKRLFNFGELREILGIKNDEYKRFYDFKKKVLLISKRDINKNTDIEINFNEHRKSKKVEAIEFTISPNKGKELKLVEDEKAQIEPETTVNPIYDRLVNYFLLSRGQAKKIINDYSEEYILEQLKNIELDFGKKEIRNKGAYAFNALMQGYQYQKSLFDVEKEQSRKNKEEKAMLIAKLKKDYENEINEKLAKVEASWTDKHEQEFRQANIDNSIVFSRITAGDTESPIVQGAKRGFIMKKFLKPEEYNFDLWLQANPSLIPMED